MTLTNKHIYSGIIAALILATALFAGSMVKKAGASASAFIDIPCSTASATTSLSYMTAGTATTTLTCPIAQGQSYAADAGTLLMQQTASSSATSKIKGVIEVSQGGSNNSCTSGDWYPINSNLIASTTSGLLVAPDGSFVWSFASSTIGGAASANTNRNQQSLAFNTPLKCVRVYFAVPPAAGNAAIWAQIIGTREI
jgi:hypothetical protein